MNFNDSQLSAIQHKDGPMLVLAGPGSGKTATLVERTKNLIVKHGVSPSNILVITFTKAAANEMKLRFQKEMEQENGVQCHGTAQVTFGTFHAIFFMILKLAYHYNSSNIITDETKYQAMRELIHRYGLEYRDENELMSGIFGEISMIKNARIPLEHFYSSQCGGDVFRKIYAEYEAFLKTHRLIDFDDMLTLTFDLFKERPDILSAWQKKYQYILVDEFQDINQIQYDIVRMMAAPEHNLFMVGDDDQSIYRFRGSKPEIMLHVPKDYPEVKQIQLDVNYRCPKAVVDASQKLIAHNKERFAKKVVAWENTSKGRCEAVAHESAAQATDVVRFQQFNNQREEILFIIKEIEMRLQKGYNLSDIAILFRTNMQPRFLMEQLMAYNVDFKTRDQIPNLYDHWIAKDIRAYIDIARGSRARKDFLMILNKPKRYIGRDSLCESQVAFDEWEKMYDEQPWIAERIEKLHYDIKMLEKMAPYAAINYIRHGIGYDDYITEYAQYRNLNKEDLFDVLDELQASAKGFNNYQAWELHIQEYTEELREKAKKKQENPNAVTLATMHSAKGLEFKSVFIIDANQGTMPYKKAVLDKDIEEERRLFYVGMTRAISDLTICAVKELHNKSAEVSQFVAEAGLGIEERKEK
ncbi:MAG: ATP-dependent helicase [Agathobacter sp.]|nr:ATP-dependent helicase [Agathobacter sp.]